MCSTMPPSLRLLRCAAMVLCLQSLGRTAHALDTDGECIVQREQQILETPLNISILVFTSPEHPLQFVLFLKDLDMVDDRDALNVTNYAAIHYKVRGGKSSNTSHPLHLVVSEGWNRLRLVADGLHLNLKWIDKNDEADLLALTLDFPLNKMSLEGLFSVCSGDSPEWDVGDGQQATVPLHPLKSEQQLVVTGQASSKPYLITDSEPIRIVTNTTLTVKIQRQNSTSVIKIVQESMELLSVQQSLRPVITVGSKGGNTHLRLSLSDPQEEQEHSRGPHPESQTITNMYILIGVLAATTITLACFLIKRRESHADQPYDDENMKNKGTVETNAAPDGRLRDKSSDEASKYPRPTAISICEDNECLAEKENLMKADHSLTHQRICDYVPKMLGVLSTPPGETLHPEVINCPTAICIDEDNNECLAGKEIVMKALNFLTCKRTQRMRDKLDKISEEGRSSHQPQQLNACTDGRPMPSMPLMPRPVLKRAVEPVSMAYDSDYDSDYNSPISLDNFSRSNEYNHKKCHKNVSFTRSYPSPSSSYQSRTDTPIPLSIKKKINVAPDYMIMDKNSNEASKHPSLMGVSIEEVGENLAEGEKLV